MRGLRPTAETLFGISTALTGLGILTVALAPLAMPILILTIAALLPLVLIGAAVALPIGLIAGLLLGIRALSRRAERRRPPASPTHAATYTDLRVHTR
jgi:hypothetical protein